MLKITGFPLGQYQTNCYILSDSESSTCCIIDPGYCAEQILDRVQEMGLKVEAILLTHGHFDHVGAVKEIAAEPDCRVFLNDRDTAMPPMFTAGPLYYTDPLHEGDVLELAGLTIRVLETPGHTPGSVCLVTEDVMFTGDTLFAGSCGRTDLPCGEHRDMLRSLQRLREMEADYRIYPGHGPSSTLSREKETNPYLR